MAETARRTLIIDPSSLLKRLLIELYCRGWIGRERLDQLFERWPSLRGA